MRPEQALKAWHAACVLHIRRAMNMLIRWTVDGGFADMFVCVHEDMHPGMFRPDGSPPGTIHSLIHPVDKSVYKGSIHRRINVSRRPLEGRLGAWNCTDGPWLHHGPLRRSRACTRPHKTGCHNSGPNLRSLGSSPCFAADAAWRYHGAKHACHVVTPQSRLIRANRLAWYHVSEAVPPQRPVVPPGVVPPVFPFVAPLCPPYAP